MDWYMPQDRLSVHVGINHRISLCRKQGLTPICIFLGKEHTRLFMKERGWKVIPKGQHYYSRRCIPIIFNVPELYGIAVEAIPRPVRAAKGRKRGGSSDERAPRP